MRTDQSGPRPEKEKVWELAQRRADRIALGIALSPIPISLLISWAMGSPPWLARVEEPEQRSEAPDHPVGAMGHGGP